MAEIIFFFELHQPRRFRRSFGKTLPFNSEKLEEVYFDDDLNREVFDRVARKCYVPALRTLVQNAKEGGFKCALGMSGLFLEQASWWNEEVLMLIHELMDTGNCELTAQTYYHSLAGLMNVQEFGEQVDEQRKILKDVFKATPTAVATATAGLQ